MQRPDCNCIHGIRERDVVPGGTFIRRADEKMLAAVRRIKEIESVVRRGDTHGGFVGQNRRINPGRQRVFDLTHAGRGRTVPNESGGVSKRDIEATGIQPAWDREQIDLLRSACHLIRAEPQIPGRHVFPRISAIDGNNHRTVQSRRDERITVPPDDIPEGGMAPGWVGPFDGLSTRELSKNGKKNYCLFEHECTRMFFTHHRTTVTILLCIPPGASRRIR